LELARQVDIISIVAGGEQYKNPSRGFVLFIPFHDTKKMFGFIIYLSN
jgi:hypothetical protein